jgi:hypothetical protein
VDVAARHGSDCPPRRNRNYATISSGHIHAAKDGGPAPVSGAARRVRFATPSIERKIIVYKHFSELLGGKLHPVGASDFEISLPHAPDF